MMTTAPDRAAAAAVAFGSDISASIINGYRGSGNLFDPPMSLLVEEGYSKQPLQLLQFWRIISRINA